MNSVRHRHVRLCDVPIGEMSDLDADKFAELVPQWQLCTVGNVGKLDTMIDLAELRKQLTPCELEIVDCRYQGCSLAETAKELSLWIDDVVKTLRQVWRKAAALGITNLELTLFERELAIAHDNCRKFNRERHERNQQQKRIAAERRQDEEYAQAALTGSKPIRRRVAE